MDPDPSEETLCCKGTSGCSPVACRGRVVPVVALPGCSHHSPTHGARELGSAGSPCPGSISPLTARPLQGARAHPQPRAVTSGLLERNLWISPRPWPRSRRRHHCSFPGRVPKPRLSSLRGSAVLCSPAPRDRQRYPPLSTRLTSFMCRALISQPSAIGKPGEVFVLLGHLPGLALGSRHSWHRVHGPAMLQLGVVASAHCSRWPKRFPCLFLATH